MSSMNESHRSGLPAIILCVVALVAVGCGGDGADPLGADGPGFASLSITITDTTLFTRPPGTTAVVTATPLDPGGREMTGLGTPAFASGDEAIATVDPAGVVTAVSAGSVGIHASLTANGVTRTASVGVVVTEGDMEAKITAPSFAFFPERVDIALDGTITWQNFDVPHNVIFTTAGAPADIPTQWAHGTRSRTFPDSGSFQFICTRHEGMFGLVVVH